VTTVAVVVPVRDGAATLRDCLRAIHLQTRPPDELWIVVGPSKDGTMEVAAELGGAAATVLPNPSGDRGSALNLAVFQSAADVFAFVDAQAVVDPTYLESALAVLESSGASCVGGPMRPIGRNTTGKAMAAALTSPFGIGDSQFHYVAAASDVEAVYLGAYRGVAIRSVGGYNEALLRTEDDDLNARLREAGHRIHLDPAIRSAYLCRNDLAAIWRQYAGYGYWKVALATVRPAAIRPRHLIPAAFVIGLVVSAVASIAGRVWALPLAGAAYAVTGLTFAARDASLGVRARLLFPLVTLAMHAGYGAGSLRGIRDWRRLARVARAGDRDAGMRARLEPVVGG
jgi:glycosyltransferase involved in cell wall biosynthesis